MASLGSTTQSEQDDVQQAASSRPQRRAPWHVERPAALSREMRREQVQKQPSIMELPCEPGQSGEHIEVQTNVFGIEIAESKTIHCYGVQIIADFGETHVDYSKNSRFDHISNDRIEKCVGTYKHMLKSAPEFFGHDLYQIWYDGKTTMYSSIDFFGSSQETEKKFCTDGDQLFKGWKNARISMIITKVGQFDLSYDVICRPTDDLDSGSDREKIRSFVQTVIDQQAILSPESHKVFSKGRSYNLHPRSQNYSDNPCPDVGEGKYLMPGLQKIVHFIEGPNGRGTGNLCVKIDAKKAAMHRQQLLIEKIDEILQGNKYNLHQSQTDGRAALLRTVLGGLAIQTTHLDKPRKCVIHDIDPRGPAIAQFKQGDELISVYDYYVKKYNIHLRHPNAPLIVTKRKDQMILLPPELCEVIPHQRVMFSQATDNQRRKDVKASAVPPARRQTDIINNMYSQNIISEVMENESHAFVKSAGLKFYSMPIPSNARKLEAPVIEYKQERGGPAQVNPNSEGSWQIGYNNYFLPGSCRVWAMYGVFRRRNREQEEVLDAFLSRLTQMSNQKGLRLPRPAETDFISEDQLEERFKAAKEGHCDFIFFVSEDSISTAHDRIKLLERKYEIATQDSRWTTVMNVIRKKQNKTLDGMLAKMNLKLGGLNYTMDMAKNGNRNWLENGRLFIGISFSPPPCGDQKMIYGYAANTGQNPHEYIGDFEYLDLYKEGTGVFLPNLIKQIYNKYTENHRGQPPKEVWVYQASQGEGQYKEVISFEIPLIRQRLPGARVVYVTVNTDHAVRLFKPTATLNPRDNAFNQNISCGIVVDQEITHPTRKEFYLNSHKAIQGSTVTPRYSVLVDDVNVPMNELEGVTYALAHNSQINAAVIGTPAPLFIAREYAKRGKALLEAYKSESKKEDVSAEELNNMRYVNSKFESIHINA